MSKEAPDQFSVDDVLSFWQAGEDDLPKELHEAAVWDRRTSEAIEELVEYLRIDEQLNDSNDLLRSEIITGVSDLNNFWNSFRPKLASKLSRGEGLLGADFALHPFAIDRAYDRAWSQMCTELRDDVRAAIRGGGSH